MAKDFAPRVKKRERKSIDLSDKLSRDLFDKLSDKKLLEGARIEEVPLKSIVVKDQVRTKFNDSSIKELAENIKANGLIQPLVVHVTGRKYTLICGERRFRAMTSIEQETAPCFILEGKTEKELMAIQFSENSAREELHYIDKADGILNYQKATGYSERKIQAALGISKSEVHRSLLIAKLSTKLKEAAKEHNIEKYVLLESDALDKGAVKNKIIKKIVAGEITKRAELKKAIKAGGIVKATKGKKKAAAVPRGMTASAFLKAMKVQSKNMDLDKETMAMLNRLVEETKEVVEDL